MTRLSPILLISFILTCFPPRNLSAAEPNPTTDYGPGLASKYPNDAGLAKDPAVLLADDFESGKLDKWDAHERKGSPTIVEPDPNSGQRCVMMPMTRGVDTGAKLVQWFKASPKVHYRVHVKFSEDFQYSHHFLCLLANHPKNKWTAFGKAGLKPDGTYYTTSMEPAFAWGKNPRPGELNLYTYSMDMEVDPKMNKFWGNSYFPPGPGKGKSASDQRVIPKLNQWQCWEFMLQANSAPDKADGKQAMWLGGKLVGEFAGIHWTNDPAKVQPNCVWLESFGYDSGDPTKQFWKDKQTVWFDDVVVATEYVGPMKQR
jgi:hypothetical protein